MIESADATPQTLPAKAQTSSTRSRIWSLDSLRGLASCAVVLQHGLALLPEFAGGTKQGWLALALTYSPLHLFWAGNEAVLIFFVLSGYVLSQQYWDGRQKSYLDFVISRWFRLYPAYVFVVAAVAALSSALIYVLGTDSVRWCSHIPWTLSYCQVVDWRPLTWLQAIQHLTMYVWGRSWIDQPIWTLVVEIQVSMIFPVIIYCMRFFRWLSIPASIVASMLAIKYIWRFTPVRMETAIEPVLDSIDYMWFFVLGAELCRRKSLIAGATATWSPWLQWAILACGAALLLKVWLLPFLPASSSPWFWGTGAALIIVSVRHFQNVRSAFEISALRWFGVRSYSLYLVHYPLMAVLVMSAGRLMPVWVVSICLLPIALLGAHWMYRYIELPGIEAGKSAAAGVAG